MDKMDKSKNIKIEKIKHDIRNLKVLTHEQIKVVFNSSNDYKNEIIKIYNEVISIWNSYFDEI